MACRGLKDIFNTFLFGSFENFSFSISICEICYNICVNEFKLIEVKLLVRKKACNYSSDQ